MPTVDLASLHGQKVFYTDSGEGQADAPGRYVVLASANPGASGDWNALVPLLAARGFRVLALDWPGYGQSPPPTDEDAAQGARFLAHVLSAFVSALALPPSIIIGNSVGGFSATKLALSKSPHVAKVILVSSGGFTRHNFVTRAACRFMSTGAAPSPHTFARFYLGHQSTSPTVKEMLHRAKTEQATPAALKVNRGVWASFATPEHDLRAEVKQPGAVSVPFMLVYGKQDYVIPYWLDGKEARKCLPESTPFVVMDTGHAPFAELPEAFMDAIASFLDA